MEINVWYVEPREFLTCHNLLHSALSNNHFFLIRQIFLETEHLRNDQKASFSLFHSCRSYKSKQLTKLVIVSILLYGCTTLTLTKRMKRKLDSNCTRIEHVLEAAFCKIATSAQTPRTHLENHPNYTSETCGTLLEK